MALIFDSLTTARMLQSKGFTSEQAEGIAEQMNQLLIQDLATKGDLQALRTKLKADMNALASELTVKIYSVGLAAVALVIAAQKLLP